MFSELKYQSQNASKNIVYIPDRRDSFGKGAKLFLMWALVNDLIVCVRQHFNI